MQRRTFLSLLAGGALAASLPARAQVSAETSVLSAWAEDLRGERRYFAGRLNGRALELPARGHALVAHPRQSRIAYACARRPGSYLIRFDAATGSVLNQIEADEARRFEGHALVDRERNRLFVTESELDQGQGRIGIYHADSLERLGEWPTHGIGPHELLWLEHDVLAVANGGILTLPETGRIKRNLEAMEPSLVLLDARDGGRLAAFTLADRKLSIRHLAVAADGTLGAALQYEGAGGAPLLALLRDAAFTTVEVAARLGNYAAAVAACGDRFAVSCTRGDCVAVWDTRGRYCGAVPMPKPAGIVGLGGEWLVSNELGELWRIDAGSLRVVTRTRASNRLWDNHLAAAA